MKKWFFFFIFSISANLLLSQAPGIIWQKCLGSLGFEYTSNTHLSDPSTLKYRIALVEGGMVVVGNTLSGNSGDVSGNHGNEDI